MDNTQPSDAQSVFHVEKFYVKECSFKAPHVPHVFQKDWKPNVSIELQVKNQYLGANQHEVVLAVQISAKNQDQTAFNLDIQQAGLFKIEGYSEETILHVVKAYIPSLLYPYLCHVAANAVMQAGFPPLVLSPVNFEQLYQQQANKQANEVSNFSSKDQTAAAEMIM